MIITASNGCLLTKSEDVAFKERRFEKIVLVGSTQEATLWKEIPESEKAQMEAENSIYEPSDIDYNETEEPTEPKPTEPDGSLENPYTYVKGETSLVKDKYYTENGIIYKAIQDAGVLIYDLSQVPAIAQKVE